MLIPLGVKVLQLQQGELVNASAAPYFTAISAAAPAASGPTCATIILRESTFCCSAAFSSWVCAAGGRGKEQGHFSAKSYKCLLRVSVLVMQRRLLLLGLRRPSRGPREAAGTFKLQIALATHHRWLELFGRAHYVRTQQALTHQPQKERDAHPLQLLHQGSRLRVLHADPSEPQQKQT